MTVTKVIKPFPNSCIGYKQSLVCGGVSMAEQSECRTLVEDLVMKMRSEAMAAYTQGSDNYTMGKRLSLLYTSHFSYRHRYGGSNAGRRSSSLQGRILGVPREDNTRPWKTEN